MESPQLMAFVLPPSLPPFLPPSFGVHEHSPSGKLNRVRCQQLTVGVHTTVDLKSAWDCGKAWYSYHPLLHFPVGLVCPQHLPVMCFTLEWAFLRFNNR